MMNRLNIHIFNHPCSIFILPLITLLIFLPSGISGGGGGSCRRNCKALSRCSSGNKEEPRMDTKLLLVQVIFRHGDRTPLFSYPNDPHKRSNSSVALAFKRKGLLTRRGKVEGYELGEFLRTRYQEFFKDTWVPEDVYAQSSETERSIMTAQTVLAGLFPPLCPEEIQPSVSECRWNKEIKWQPIPVYTIHRKWDNKLHLRWSSCPAYEPEIDKVLSCKVMQAFINQYQECFEYIQRESGLPKVDMKTVGQVYDTLYIQSLYALPLPNWTKAVYPEPLKTVNDVGFQVLSANKKLMRLNGGPLLKKVIENMEEARLRALPICPSKRVKKPKKRPVKLFLWSGHDTTVSAFLSTLNVFDIHQPPYTAAVMVELHHVVIDEDDDEKGTLSESEAAALHRFIVKVFYRNNSDEPPREMIIPHCGNPCYLDKFKHGVRDLLLTKEEWQEECKVNYSFFNWLMRPFTAFFGFLWDLLTTIFNFFYGLVSSPQVENNEGGCGCKQKMK